MFLPILISTAVGLFLLILALHFKIPVQTKQGETVFRPP